MTIALQRKYRVGHSIGWLALGWMLIPCPATAQEVGDAHLPQVEPIVSDEEFRQSIPALEQSEDQGADGELYKPLESIAEFERRMAAEDAATQPQGSDTPGAAQTAAAASVLDDGDVVEEIGDALISDKELLKPLLPIDRFEVTPVEYAQAEDALEETSIRYETRLNGLESANQESGTDLAAMFRSLSALEKNSEAANVAMISARLDEDADLMSTLLASEGWYSPIVSARIERPDEGDSGPYRAVLDITPGQRYVFSEIIVAARPTVPPGLARDNLPLSIGEPIIAERVQRAEANVTVALGEQGYPFAKIGQRDILLDRETGEGAYTLPVEIGPRSRFGDFATQGEAVFDPDHIAVLARFRRGELYDRRKIDDLRKALVATGLLSTVSVEPVRSGESAGEDSTFATILVNQTAGPPRTIAGSAGYGSGEGFRLEASWTHRNMFPPEGAVIFSGVAGTREQGAGATFRRANAGKRDRTFELVGEVLHSEFDAFSAYTGRLAARISRDSTPIWQKRMTYSFGAELLATAEKDYDPASGMRDRQTYFIGGLNGELGIDHSNDLLDPTRGFRLTTLIQPEASIDGGFTPYVRARVDGSAYYPVSDGLVIAGRFRLGTIQAAKVQDVAPSRRLYAGGGGSVRGYGYQQLGPLDPFGDPTGGRSLNELSAEVRYRFSDFGIVGFVDAGQSYARTTPDFSNLRYGAGIGGRYYTNFGPLRVDIATPIDRRPGESRVNVYISIGQAF